MSAAYESSTTKLKMESQDNLTFSGNSNKKKMYMMIAIFVLAVLAVVFLCLYISKNNDYTELKAGSTGKNTGGDTSPTEAPKTEKPTTTAPPTTAPPSTAPPTTVPPTAAPKDKCVDFGVRLPKTTLPTHYDVNLNTNMNTNNNKTKFLVTGTTDITIHVTSPTKYVQVHAKGYMEIQATVEDANGANLEIVSQFNCSKPEHEFHVIEMKSNLTNGVYKVKFQFKYKLREDMKGYYKATYKDKAGIERYVAATQMEPVDARAAFPCFDEPAMKATFNMTLGHHKDYFALCNMPIESNTTEGDIIHDRFEKTPVMPTYLIAFVICDFASKTGKTMPLLNGSKPVDMTYYAPKDQIDQIEYAKVTGLKILAYFEEYFNVAYPLPKADMIAIPDFSAGAMENWGLITYRMAALLFDENSSSESNRQYIAAIVAHELAHQWFGNIVTMDWWSDLWLNEGFASYVEYIGIRKIHPEWKAFDMMVTADMTSGMALDSLVTSHPIYIDVQTPAQIGEIFDSISYQKGGSILRMLNNYIGEDAFVHGLDLYLKKFQYANARTDDLWDYLSKGTAAKNVSVPIRDVKTVMDSWTTQMGFPVINVKREVNGSISLKQERFMRDPNPDYSKEKFNSTKYKYTWYVPFKYTTYNAAGPTSGKSDLVMMELNNVSIAGVPSGSFIKGNAGQYGFYRVNYDDKMWANINNLLQSDATKIPATDRAGLLGDAFALAQAGRLPYKTALELFSYLSKEKEYLPWKAGSNAISFIPDVLTSTRPALKYYQQFILKTVKDRYTELAINKVFNNPTHLDTYLRTVILGKACHNGHEGCISGASDMFQKWMRDPNNKTTQIPPDLRSLVYFYGVYNGGLEEWDFLWNRFQKNQIASEKTKLLYGLAATQEPWIIKRYLEYGLDTSKVKGQDVSYVFSYVANSNPRGRWYAWDYMTSNFPRIQKRFADSFFTMRRIIGGVTSGFTTKYELEQVVSFVDGIKNKNTADRVIAQAKEKITSRIDWLDRNEKDVEAWLKAATGN